MIWLSFQNSKFEYRNTKQIRISNDQMKKQNHCRGFDYIYGLEHLNFGH